MLKRFLPITFGIVLLIVTPSVIDGGWWWYENVLQPAQHFQEALLQAERGDSEAQYEVGRIYTRDKCAWKHPVACDGAKGEAWLARAAEQGNTRAQLRLAWLYSEENDGWLGLKSNDEESYYWFSIAMPTQEPATSWKAKVEQKLTPREKAAVDKRVAAWKKAHPVPAPGR